MMDWYGGMWWMIFGGFFMLVFWVGIIVLVVWGVKKLLEARGSNTSQKRDPMDIAKERYAKGEISKEEFAQIKKDLL